MSNLFQVGVVGQISDSCGGLGSIVRLIKKGLFPIIQIGIPLLLIVLGTIDLAKAVIASEDKEVKAATTRLVKRAIYAVAIFFITTIVTLVMSLVTNAVADGETNTTGWATCWNSIN